MGRERMDYVSLFVGDCPLSQTVRIEERILMLAYTYIEKGKFQLTQKPKPVLQGERDAVLEVAGSEETFRMAWECARPNAVVTVVALYDGPQILPLPDMYGKNLTFKTGGVDGCSCAEILELIREGKIDTVPLITHTYPLREIEKAYDLFESHRDGVMKIALKTEG